MRDLDVLASIDRVRRMVVRLQERLDAAHARIAELEAERDAADADDAHRLGYRCALQDAADVARRTGHGRIVLEILALGERGTDGES